MQGTLKRLGDNFGFFDTSDGDVYVRRIDLPNDSRDGDRFELDAEDRGGKSPVATNIRFISHGAAPPARRDDARGRDRPDRDARRDRQNAIVPTWTFGDPILQTYRDGDLPIEMLEVPLTISIKDSTRPKRGVRLVLKANGQPVRDPEEQINVDDDGQALFVLGLEPVATQAHLSLTVYQGDQLIAVFSKHWERKLPQLKAPRHITVQQVSTDGTWTMIRIHTATGNEANAEGIKTTVLVESHELEVEGSGTGSSIKIETEDNGYALKKMRFTKPHKGEVAFRIESNPAVEAKIEIETKAPAIKQARHIKAQKLGSDGAWTTIRVLTLTSDKAEGEQLEAEVLAECGSEIEIEGAGVASHSVEVKIDNGSKLVRFKLTKPGKAEVSFRLKDDTRVESDPIEIETKAPKTCRKITTRMILGRPGHSNAFEIETLADVSDNAPKLDAEVVIEHADEMVAEIDGTEQRGRQIRFSSGTTGNKVVRVFFVAPNRYGHVALYSALDPSVRTEVFVRHPATAAKP